MLAMGEQKNEPEMAEMIWCNDKQINKLNTVLAMCRIITAYQRKYSFWFYNIDCFYCLQVKLIVGCYC